MKKAMKLHFLLLILTLLTVSGCAVEQGEESAKPTPEEIITIEKVKVEASEDDPLMYLEVVDAEASSFDETPDWAPEPNPMAPVDGDMLT
ncbi:MAG: hypothetical protein ACE5JK_07790, partial [Candidatus Omnitrophota bacterium]